jgi:hypothetical protein
MRSPVSTADAERTRSDVNADGRRPFEMRVVRRGGATLEARRPPIERTNGSVAAGRGACASTRAARWASQANSSRVATHARDLDLGASATLIPKANLTPSERVVRLDEVFDHGYVRR